MLVLDPIDEELWSSGDAEEFESGAITMPTPVYNASTFYFYFVLKFICQILKSRYKIWTDHHENL